MAEADDSDNEDEYQTTEIPTELKNLHACMRCGLIKTLDQFIDRGCENCSFLNMYGNTIRARECTTSYFEGIIALVEPKGSWVAKWQRIADFYPGMYAIELIGELPEDVVEYCDSEGIDYKARKKQTAK